MRKYDYISLETEFIKGTMSIRQLARMHSIPDSRVSAIHYQAKRLDGQGRTWYDKRAELADRSSNKTLQVLADREAARRLRESEVVDNALGLIDDAVSSARETLRLRVEMEHADGSTTSERKYRVQLRDVTALIDRLHALFGRPQLNEEETPNFSGHVNLNVNTDAESEFGVAVLSRLAGLSRNRSGAAHARPVGGGTLPSAEDTRSN